MGICQDPNGFLGRAGNLLYYMCKGKRMVRTFDSNYMSKRVKKDPKYELLRVYGKLFGQASKIASAVYKTAPAELRGEVIFKGLQSEATRLFKRTGMTEDDMREYMTEKYVGHWGNKRLVEQLRRWGSKEEGSRKKKNVSGKKATVAKKKVVTKKIELVKKKAEKTGRSKNKQSGKNAILKVKL
ncbi:MAG: hypothetical protein J7527_01380 [Chitinophagaceae bacterium]|nr:hypothetical protein [Chitinophagaceae bacterium]